MVGKHSRYLGCDDMVGAGLPLGVSLSKSGVVEKTFAEFYFYNFYARIGSAFFVRYFDDCCTVLLMEVGLRVKSSIPFRFL